MSMMDGMARLLQDYQVGLLNPTSFRRQSRYRLAKQISKDCAFEINVFPNQTATDFDLQNNQLLVGQGGSRADIFDVEDVSGVLNSRRWKAPRINDLAIYENMNMPYRECISWGIQNKFFNYSGSLPAIYTVDTERLNTVDVIILPGVRHTSQHRQHREKSLVAIGCDLNAVLIIDLKSGNASRTADSHSTGISTLAWSPLHEYVLASACSEKLCIWDVRMTNKSRNIQLDNLKSTSILFPNDNNKKAHSLIPEIQFIPGTNTLVGITSSRKLFILDLDRKLTDIRAYDEISSVRMHCRLKFSLVGDSNPPLLFMPFESSIKLINLSTMDIINELNGHILPVQKTIYNPLKNELYSACGFNKMVWVV